MRLVVKKALLSMRSKLMSHATRITKTTKIKACTAPLAVSAFSTLGLINSSLAGF